MDGRTGLGALGLAALLWATALGAAQAPVASLALSPPTLALTTPPLVPGETRIAHLTVFNSGGEEVDVTATGAEPAGAWITAVPAAFHLGPDGQAEVTLRIDVPHDAAKGRHLGRIDFIPVASAGAAGNQVLSGVSGLLDISVDPTAVHDLAVEAMRVANIHVGEPLPVAVDARNRGNVQDAYRLEVSVLDVARATVHLHTTFDAAPLTAGDRRTDTFNATVDLPEGQYAYTLTATLKGSSKVLRTEQGLFQVAGPGAKFRLGTLPLLSVAPPEPKAGEEVRVLALFRNEGALDLTEVRFTGTVLRDGTPVATLEAAPVAVGAQRNATLLAAYTPGQAGTYLVRGHAVYDGLVTEDQEAAFEVSAAAPSFLHLPGLTLHLPAWLGTPLGLLLLLVGLLGLLALWRRAFRREKRDPPPAEAGPGTPSPAWLRARPELAAAAQPPRAQRSWGWFLFRRAAGSHAGPAPPQKPSRPWLARALTWLRRAPRNLLRKGSGKATEDKPGGLKGVSGGYLNAPVKFK
ncbi:MAG: hypothetical protein LC623_06680 [Halobacteriales archaeon]|nr:hypothetical protein [Halobacteriales archaeon]